MVFEWGNAIKVKITVSNFSALAYKKRKVKKQRQLLKMSSKCFLFFNQQCYLNSYKASKQVKEYYDITEMI